MRTILMLALAGTLWAQSAPPVNPSSGPPPAPIVKLFCDATSCTSAYTTLAYVCYAAQPGPTTTWSVAASTLTNVVDSTTTATVTTASAHGLWIGAHVTIAGVTTSGGTALNASYPVLTVPSSTSFTITTAGVSTATYTDSGLTLTTTSPLITAARWAILVLGYNSGTLMSAYWARDSVGFGLACSNRTSY